MSENAAGPETGAATTTAAAVPSPAEVASATANRGPAIALGVDSSGQHEHYPEDHPLVKALAAQKAQIQELKEMNDLKGQEGIGKFSEYKEKAARLDEIEAQRAKDEQTWQQRAETAEAALASRDKTDARNHLAREVVKGTGFAVELLDGLATEDQMRARVELLKELKGPGTPTAPPASVVGNADATPANQVRQLSRADLQTMTPAQIRDADAKGQLDELKGVRK